MCGRKRWILFSTRCCSRNAQDVIRTTVIRIFIEDIDPILTRTINHQTLGKTLHNGGIGLLRPGCCCASFAPSCTIFTRVRRSEAILSAIEPSVMVGGRQLDSPSLFWTGQRVRMIRSGSTGTINVTYTLIPGYYDVHLDGTTSCRVVFETDIEALDVVRETVTNSGRSYPGSDYRSDQAPA